MTTPPVGGLPMEPGRNGGPVKVPCPTGRCNLPHDPRKCTGHKDLEDGTRQPCGRYPSAGLKVCRSHGAGAPQVKAAGERAVAEQQAEQALARLAIPRRRVEDPLRELQTLAGEVLGWKELLASKVAAMDGFTGGEQATIRGEVVLFERAMDRCARVLEVIGKLDIDRRLAAIQEWQLQTFHALLEVFVRAYNDALALDAERRERVAVALEAGRAAAAAEVERRLGARQIEGRAS